jgi:WD40-like Beta Propeller Repeat/Matrixin
MYRKLLASCVLAPISRIGQRSSRLIVVACTVAVTGSCGGGGDGTTPPATTPPSTVAPQPARLELISGGGQRAEVGRILDAPIVIALLASNGVPIRDVEVQVALTVGRGELTVDNPRTDASGRVSVRWRLGLTDGPSTISASVPTAPSLRLEVGATTLPVPSVTLPTDGTPVLLAGGAVELRRAAGGSPLMIDVRLNDTVPAARAVGYPTITLSRPLESLGENATLVVRPLSTRPGNPIALQVARVDANGDRVPLPTRERAADGALVAEGAQLDRAPASGMTAASRGTAAAVRAGDATYEVLDARMARNRDWWYRIDASGASFHSENGETAASVVIEAFDQWNAITTQAPFGIRLRHWTAAGNDGAPSSPDIEVSFRDLSSSVVLGQGGTSCQDACTERDKRYVRFNRTFAWQADRSGSGRVGLSFVALHEIGHVLGVRHFNYQQCDDDTFRNTPGSDAACGVGAGIVMAYLASSSRFPLGCPDFDNFFALYGPSTSPTAPRCFQTLEWPDASTIPTRVLIGSDLRALTRVRTLDAAGRPVPRVPFVYRIREGSGLTRVVRTATDDAGRQAFPGTWVAASGAASVTSDFGSTSFRQERLVVEPEARVESGDEQSAPPSTELSRPLVVRVVSADVAGQPLAGLPVRFAVVIGGGSLSAQDVVTDTDGLAEVRWRLGSVIGPQRVEATVAGARFPARFFASAVTTSLIASPSSRSFGATANAALPVSQTIAISASTGSLTGLAPVITYATGSGWLTATVSPTATPATLTLRPNTTALAAGTYNATVRVTAAGGVFADIAVSYVVTGVTSLRIDASAGVNQTGTVGQPLPNPVVVLVRDANTLAPLSGRAVSFAAAAGNGTVSSASATTGVDGKASITWILGTTAGQQSVTATLAGAQGSPVTFTATARAGAAARIVMAGGNNQSGVPGSTLANLLEAQVVDQYSNGVSNANVGWAVVAGGGSFQPSGLLQQTVATDTRGFASVQWRIGAGSGTNNNSATASATGLTGSPLTFLASGQGSSAASRLGVLLNPSSTAAGAAIAPAVQIAVQTAAGTTVTTASNSITVTLGSNSTGAILTGTTTRSAVNGVASFNDLRVDRAGIYTLIASSNGLTGTTSSTFTVSAASTPAGTLLFSSYSGGASNLYSVELDGTQLKSLGLGRAGAYSPDGSRILFSYSADNNEVGANLYLMNSDGTGRQLLIAGYCGSWSPSGTQIAYSRWNIFTFESEIFVVTLASGANTKVGTGECPAWSPNGSRIAFTRSVALGGRGEIWISNADGTGAARIASDPTLSLRSVSWSTDGSKLAYVAYDGNTALYTVQANGSNRTAITGFDRYVEDPIWLADQRTILVIAGLDGDTGLYMITVDGGVLSLVLRPTIVATGGMFLSSQALKR